MTVLLVLRPQVTLLTLRPLLQLNTTLTQHTTTITYNNDCFVSTTPAGYASYPPSTPSTEHNTHSTQHHNNI